VTVRDVVVVGGGHNGLVAACYLARAGLDVEVVERDTVLGGAVSTVPRWPGYAVDRGSSAHVMIRHSGIVEELELAAHGLSYDDVDPWGFAPFGDAADPAGQVAITFWADLDRTCASIAAVCGQRDAAAYRRFVLDWGRRNERVFAAFGEPPTPARIGRRLWGLGRDTGLSGLELSRQFLGSGDALLDSLFTDERLKTALAWMGAQSGPPTHEPGTADLVGWIAMLHRHPPGHPHGGSGALTVALGDALRAAGGTLRLGDGAAAIETRDGSVSGVRTVSGDTVAARQVVAGCHVGTTLGLLGAGLPVELGRRAAQIDPGNGIGMVVRLGTTALPAYPSDTEGVAGRSLQLLAPSRRALRAAYGDFLADRPPERPVTLAMSFSSIDDTIAPAGRHNVSIWGQWHPYQLADGDWSQIGDREADKLVAEVDRLAPGFAAGIEHTHVQTPADLERELGLPRGNVMHVPMNLASMFWSRPLPELAGYRVPGVRGLFLTGASMHPGGGVSGLSGRTVARLALADRAPRRLPLVGRRSTS
jgi:phytoene dehydrogenase-like protein